MWCVQIGFFKRLNIFFENASPASDNIDAKVFVLLLAKVQKSERVPAKFVNGHTASQLDAPLPPPQLHDPIG